MSLIKLVHLTISLSKKQGEIRFTLGNPISVSRVIRKQAQSQAFSLPMFISHPIEIPDEFTGDVSQGGSCNVDLLSFTPHNLTHIETSAHILDHTASNVITLADIPTAHLHGLVYLVDISHISFTEKLIQVDLIKEIMQTIDLPISAMALKTKSSSLPQHTDFTEQNVIALSEASAKLIHDYNNGSINCLILDLPSADPEHDSGSLFAHRAFFGLPRTGHKFFSDQEKRVICELAHFGHPELGQNYYYFITTPSRIESNAIITDIYFFPLIQQIPY